VQAVRFSPPAATTAPWALAALSVSRSSTLALVAGCVFLRYLAVVCSNRAPVRTNAWKLRLGAGSAVTATLVAVLSDRPATTLLIAALAGAAGGFFAAATAEVDREPRGLNLPPALLTSFWRAVGAALGLATAVFSPLLLLVLACAAVPLTLVNTTTHRHKTRLRVVSPLSSVTHALVNATPVIVFHLSGSEFLSASSLVLLQAGSAFGLLIAASSGHRAHVVGPAPFVTGVTHRLASSCALATAAGYAAFSARPAVGVMLAVTFVLGTAGELAKHAHIATPDAANGVSASVVTQTGLLLAGPVGYLATTSLLGLHALAGAAAVLTLVLQLSQPAQTLRR
jgi:hypothetical protein